jgi:hypothetical protein
MFYYIVSDKNGEMHQRSYSIINRLQHVIASKSNHINIMLPNEIVLTPLQRLKIKYELSYQSTTRLKYKVTLHFKRCGLKKYGKMKCLMTSCTRKTSNVAIYIRFTEY